MSIAINGLDGNPFTTRDLDATPNNFIYTSHKLGFSGNYATGGDTLDFTAIAGLVGTGSVPLAVEINTQGTAATPSQSAAGGYYAIVQAASPALNNYKLKIFSAGGTELGAGAYGAAITTDVVQLQVQWRKLI